MISNSAQVYYERRFCEELKDGIDHHHLKVTPFKFPVTDFDSSVLQVVTENDQSVPVIIHGDFVNFPERLTSNLCIDPYIEDAVKRLAQRYIGAYKAFCTHAKEQHGSGCGVSTRHKLRIVPSIGPGLCPGDDFHIGWASFSMQFVACPQSWLAYVLPLEKKNGKES